MDWLNMYGEKNTVHYGVIFTLIFLAKNG